MKKRSMTKLNSESQPRTYTFLGDIPLEVLLRNVLTAPGSAVEYLILMTPKIGHLMADSLMPPKMNYLMASKG